MPFYVGVAQCVMTLFSTNFHALIAVEQNDQWFSPESTFTFVGWFYPIILTNLAELRKTRGSRSQTFMQTTKNFTYCASV